MVPKHLVAHPRARSALDLAATLFRASHPEPVVAMTTATALLAAGSGKGARRAVLATIAVLAGQLFTGWTNDVLDIDLDRRARRQDKPVATGEVATDTVRKAMRAALPVALGLSRAVGPKELKAHATGLGAAAAYNFRLRDTQLSFLPYAVAFPMIPIFAAGEAPPAWVLLAAALIGGAAHFGQVLPDIETDREAGVMGLPQRLGVDSSARAAAGLLTAAGAVLTVATRRPRTALAAGAAILSAAGAVKVAGEGKPKTAFRLIMLSAGLLGAGYAMGRRATQKSDLVDEADERDLPAPDGPVVDDAPGHEVHLGDDPGPV